MLPVRRSLLALLLALSLPLLGHAQNSTTGSSASTVGTLVYFEGSVEVKSPDGAWTAAKIEQTLRRNHQLRTGPTATAEIKWQNGAKSTIGPQTTQKLGPFYDEIESQSGESSDGIVGKFVELFQGQGTSSDDVGGIRRASVETDTPGPGELYWKTFEEVSFDEAQQQFQNGNYATATRQFHLFVQQNPDHAKVPKAKLGMGLCYLKLNNPDQARSALTSLVSDHPDDPLAERARQILGRL